MATAPRPARSSAETRLAEAVSQLTHGWMRLARERARTLDLSFPQMMILGFVHRSGRVPASRWVEMMGASPSATTSLLDGLENMGLLRRAHGMRDRRQVLVALTPKGERLMRQIRTDFMRQWRLVCEQITTERLESASQDLERISYELDASEGFGTEPLASPRAGGGHR